VIRDEGSVTRWLVSLKANDEGAAQRLYERYLRRLMRAARARLKPLPRGLADEEDVAHSAMFDLFNRVRQNGFPRLDDREDLWQVLIMLTQRRAADLKRRMCCQKRNGRPMLGETAVGDCGSAGCQDYLIEQLIERGPSPEFAAEFLDLCDRLLSIIDDPVLKQIVAWKIEGQTNAEIAARIGRTARTVERKLRLVCETWQADAKQNERGE
jgi:DNA-directed RNA polymerase specialized sigma24 family protein